MKKIFAAAAIIAVSLLNAYADNKNGHFELSLHANAPLAYTAANPGAHMDIAAEDAHAAQPYSFNFYYSPAVPTVGAGLTATWFFNDAFGLSAGAKYQQYRSNATSGDGTIWSGQYISGDFTGMVRNGNIFRNYLVSFQEKDEIAQVEIPVMAVVNYKGFRLGAGASVNIPVYGRYTQSATEIGYSNSCDELTGPNYSAIGIALFDSNTFNAYTDAATGAQQVSYDINGKLNTRINFSARLEAGYLFRLSEKVGIYAGIEASYGLSNMIAQSDHALLEHANPTTGALDINDLHHESILAARAASYVRGTRQADGTVLYEAYNNKAHYTDFTRALSLNGKIALVFGGKSRKIQNESAPAAAPVEYVYVHDTVTVEKVDTVFVEIPAEVKEAFAKVNFDFDKDNLTASAKKSLDRVVDWLLTNNSEFVITGHCDGKGSEEYNLDLSRRRCVSVVNYLVDNGIAPERLSYKGYGKGRPVEDNVSDEGRAENRRVEIFVKGHNPYEGQAERNSTYNEKNELVVPVK